MAGFKPNSSLIDAIKNLDFHASDNKENIDILGKVSTENLSDLKKACKEFLEIPIIQALTGE